MENYPEFTVEAEALADMEDSEEREVLALIRKKPGGKLCLVEVEGYTVSSGGETEEVEEETEGELPPEMPFDEAVMTKLGRMT